MVSTDFQFRRRLDQLEGKDAAQDGDLQSLDNRVTRLEQDQNRQDGDINAVGGSVTSLEGRVGADESKIGDNTTQIGNARNEASQAKADAAAAASDAAQARQDAASAAADAAAAGSLASDAKTRADAVTDKVDRQIEPSLVGKVDFADFRDHENEFGTFRNDTNTRLGAVESDITGLKTGVQEAKDAARTAQGDSSLALGMAQENGREIDDIKSRNDAQSGQISRLTNDLDRVSNNSADNTNKVNTLGRGIDSFKFNLGEAAQAGAQDLRSAGDDLSDAASDINEAEQKWSDASSAAITSVNGMINGATTLINGAVNLSWSSLETGFNTLKSSFSSFISFPRLLGQAAQKTISGVLSLVQAVRKSMEAAGELRKGLSRADEALPEFRE